MTLCLCIPHPGSRLARRNGRLSLATPNRSRQDSGGIAPPAFSLGRVPGHLPAPAATAGFVTVAVTVSLVTGSLRRHGQNGRQKSALGFAPKEKSKNLPPLFLAIPKVQREIYGKRGIFRFTSIHREV